MTKQEYSTSITVNAPALETFNNINSISKWWSEDFVGKSGNLNDTFTVRFGETWITIRILELTPQKKIVWQVTDCYKHWLKDKKEWKDTKIVWELKEEKKRTRINFTHIGLAPGMECYDVCEDAWNSFIKGSLFNLITKEKGQPAVA